MCFGEDIGNLISRRNRVKMHNAIANMLTDEMAIDLNVFGTIMEDIIVSNLHGTAIVTMEGSSTRMRNTHVRKQLSKPNELLRSISESTVLSLSAGASNNRLFLALPRNKRKS